MDIFKKLRLEFPGIKSHILDYTSEGNIVNYVYQLENAIGAKDLETIQYTLESIYGWYIRNIDRIFSSSMLYDESKEEHSKNKDLILELMSSFQSYTFLEQEQAPLPIEKGEQNKMIFLSHCSANKKYSDALRNFIVNLGIKNEQLIYTSHPLHKVPLDHDIYEYLRSNLDVNVFIIILWSNQYLESPACLNEMGAAWLAQSDYTNIYVPDFAFDNPKYHECAVNTRKMGAILSGDQSCKASMIEFKNKIEKMFNLKNDEQQTSFLLDQFLKEIGE